MERIEDRISKWEKDLAAELKARRKPAGTYRQNRQLNLKKFSFEPSKKEKTDKIDTELRQTFKQFVNKEN